MCNDDSRFIRSDRLGLGQQNLAAEANSLVESTREFVSMIKLAAREVGDGISRRLRDRWNNREMRTCGRYALLPQGPTAVRAHRWFVVKLSTWPDRGGGWRARTDLNRFKPFAATRPYTGRGVSRLILSPAPDFALVAGIPRHCYSPPPEGATAEHRRERRWLMSPSVRQPQPYILYGVSTFGFFAT